jgi:hypothetical protein
MNVYYEIKSELDNLSNGQMVNMYEVHVRDLELYTPEKVEQLKIDVSKKLGLTGGEQVVILDQVGDEGEPEERLTAVMQDPKVCAIT